MNPWAAPVIAGRPTAGAPSLIVRDPCSAKNAATLAASWLHHAAVYFAPNSFNLSTSIAVSVERAGRERNRQQRRDDCSL
jgi:hypothetical protein